MSAVVLEAVPLTAAAFAPFGEVIETAGHAPRLINEGTSERFDDLAPVDVLANGGRAPISIFKATPRPLSLKVNGPQSPPVLRQAVFSLDGLPFLVVVAEPGDSPWAGRIRAFRAAGNQGVSYRRNTWHHALLALGRTCHFLVIDRGGPEENCDEVVIEPAVVVTTTLS